jgi:hypothetical protein
LRVSATVVAAIMIGTGITKMTATGIMTGITRGIEIAVASATTTTRSALRARTLSIQQWIGRSRSHFE